MKKILFISITIASVFLSCKKNDATNSNKDITSQINEFPIEPLTADETLSLKWMRRGRKISSRCVYHAIQ